MIPPCVAAELQRQREGSALLGESPPAGRMAAGQAGMGGTWRGPIIDPASDFCTKSVRPLGRLILVRQLEVSRPELARCKYPRCECLEEMKLRQCLEPLETQLHEFGGVRRGI